eukprot:gene1024-12698_t
MVRTANKSFFVKITAAPQATVQLEPRIPAGFLSGLTALAVVKRALRTEGRDPKDPIADFSSGVDKIQVFLENA